MTDVSGSEEKVSTIYKKSTDQKTPSSFDEVLSLVSIAHLRTQWARIALVLVFGACLIYVATPLWGIIWVATALTFAIIISANEWCFGYDRIIAANEP